MKNIEIYGRSDCRHTRSALSFCEARALTVVFRDIGSTGTFEELFRRNPQAALLPQIFIGEQLIGGFDDLATLSLHHLQQMVVD